MSQKDTDQLHHDLLQRAHLQKVANAETEPAAVKAEGSKRGRKPKVEKSEQEAEQQQ